MGQINTNNYPTVDSLADADLLIVENATNGTGTTTPKQLRENAIGTDPLQTSAQTVTGAINELKGRIDGGGSYSAGAGINIANDVITNIRRGALPGVIDEITSGGYAHTQINDALNSITAGGLVVLKAEASGSASNVQIQYGAQASQSQTYRLCDTDLEYTTINVSVGDTIILMFDTTGYKLIVLSILNNNGGSGGDSYAGLGIGKMTSFTNNVIDTDIDLHRAPVEGDRLLVYISETVSNPSSIKIYNNGVAVTTDITFSQTYPVGLAMFRYTLLGWNCIQTIAYSAGTGISITGTTISNSAPQLGMNIDYGEVTSVTDGNIGAFNGNADYLDIDFKVNASPYNGSYTLYLAMGGSTVIMKYATLKDNYGSAYDKDIQQGTILHCLSKVSGTGTAQDPFVVKVIDENVIANPTGTPDYNLKKVKVGNYIYDASSIKPYEAYSISNGGISIHTADPSTYNGQIIAVSTGTHSGTTTNAWYLVLVGNGSSYPIAMTNADGTDFKDALSENELLLVYVDTHNPQKAILLKTAGASGGDEPVIPVLNKESVYSLNDVNSISKTFTAAQTASYMVIMSICNSESLPTITSASVAVNNVAQEVKDYYVTSGYGVNSKYALLNLEAGDTVSASLISSVEAYGTSTSIALVRLSHGIKGLTLITSDYDINVEDPAIDVNVNDDGLYLLFFFDRHAGVGTFQTLKQNDVTITQNKIVCSSGSGWQVSHGMCIVSAKAMDNFKASMVVNGYFTAVGIMSLSASDGDTALSDLTDVDITSPTDGQVLTYNGTTGKWGNQTPSGGVAESVVGTVENGTTASQAYAVGEHFIRNDKFCTALATIASGATLTLNTNYVEGTIAENLSRATTYSSSETEIGTWLGQTLYRKVIDTGTLPNSTEKRVSDGISGNIRVISLHGAAFKPTNGEVRPLPFSSDDLNYVINVKYLGNTGTDAHKVYLYSKSNYSDFTSSYVVLEYIKL